MFASHSPLGYACGTPDGVSERECVCMIALSSSVCRRRGEAIGGTAVACTGFSVFSAASPLLC
ncbi:hypothetical protein [Scytonema sp. PRP1]|uniref:hypothetical protein n=1 Tax=Scytonema sp. PRP1 TaxID=3120513 RepID=UPI00300C159E